VINFMALQYINKKSVACLTSVVTKMHLSKLFTPQPQGKKMKFQISKCRNRVSAILAMAILTLGMGSANAIVITLAGGPTNIAFSGTGGPYNLGVSGSFDLLSLSSTSAVLRIVLSNTSTLTGGGQIVDPSTVRLSSFGFGITPNVSAVAFGDGADGGMINAALGSIPTLSQIEVCAFGGPNCSGGGNGGILVGGSDTFDLTLTGAFSGLTALTFDPLGVKFQTNLTSYEFINDGQIPTDQLLPEPTSMALLGAGLLGFAALRRKMVTDKR
jgi:hypothetical protein